MARLTRRTFLRLAGIGGAGAAVGGGLVLARLGGAEGTTGAGPEAPADTDLWAPEASRPAAPAKPGTRRLVVVELEGGLDGLAALVPHADPAYRRLRPRLAPADTDLIDLGGGMALASQLGRLHRRGLAVVQGVGVAEPDLSHFAMMARWWAGDPDGTAGAVGATGFLGRVCDTIGNPAAPAVGVSIGGANGAALSAERVTTMALPDPGAADVLLPPGADAGESQRAWFHAYRTMMEGADTPWPALSAARRGGLDALAFAATLAALRDGEDTGGPDYPGSDLGQSLALAARLLAADGQVRVVHVATGGFDTHEGQAGTLPGLLDDVDASIDAFLADCERLGFGDDVVVATTSEFGRRAADNGSSGTDHGTASIAMVAGNRVRPGLHGEHPSLSALDDDDNLVATVLMDEYLGALAEGWMGAPAPEVLPGGRRPLAGLFR